jgi:hypothetical protein
MMMTKNCWIMAAYYQICHNKLGPLKPPLFC